MARLIDKDVLIAFLQKDPLYPLVERYGISGVIDSQQTVDAVPVRHGKWLYGESESGQDGYYCSHCMGHVRWYGKAGGQSIDFISDYHYCPNCGARMDAERKEE